MEVVQTWEEIHRIASQGAKRLVGAPIRRKEDFRFITGQGNYVDDIKRPNMLYVSILRSPHPHAKIVEVRTEAAQSDPRVKAVLTSEDVKRSSGPMTIRGYIIPDLDGMKSMSAYCLAIDKVRFVGEPVVAVAAEDR